MNKLLLVDANNLAFRVAFANSNLSIQLPIPPEAHPDDGDKYVFPTGVLFGFFRIIAMLRNSYPSHYLAIVWDGGYAKRLELTKEAFERKIVPELYKANRKKSVIPKEIENLFKQKQDLRDMISLTNIPQIVMEGEEADDVIASYTKRYAPIAEDIILYTNDGDYHQLLKKNVRLLIQDRLLDDNLFSSMQGVRPEQWIDVGGLWGDDGDNIFGVPGWGEKTSLDGIKTYGTLENLLQKYHEEMDPLRVTYPDLKGEEFQKLKELKTPKGKPKWAELGEHLPFTGVAWALEQKLIKKPKTTILALMFEERARLAKVLKTMRDELNVPDLPGWNGVPEWDRNQKDKFIEYCVKYRLNEVLSVSELICGKQG